MEFPHDAEHLEIQKRHLGDKSSASQPKRIIICCDGTWQSAVSGEKNVPSNVTRLCRAITPVGTDTSGKKWQQTVWYDSGVGTTSLALGTAIEGATGQGLEGNVIEAYNFCVLNYNVGDQIMIFGFSRGAYTARTIAGVITDIGLCKKKDLNKFPELWTLYKAFKVNPQNQGKRFFHSEQWFKWLWGMADVAQGAGDDKKKNSLSRRDVEWAQDGSRNVEVVGVYDTVGAIGMPEIGGFKIPQWMLFWQEKPGWHNVGLSTHIKHAFQALAIDERRKAFEPTIFYVPPKPETNLEKEMQDRVNQARANWQQKFEEAQEVKKGIKGERPTDAAVNKAAAQANEAALDWNTAFRQLINHRDKLQPATKLAQVWFPGYHINIGGGSTSTMENRGNMEEMSNIAYAWMLDQVKKHLSLDEEQTIEEYQLREEIFTMNNEKRDAWNKMTAEESWGAWAWRQSSQIASAVVHPRTPGPEPPFKKRRSYDWGAGPMDDSFTKMYWPNGEHIRIPGRYAFKNGQRKDPLGETFEYIHPVVQYRIDRTQQMKKAGEDVMEYTPRGPKFNRRLVVDKDSKKPFYVWDLEYSFDPDPITMREWRLGSSDCYERKAIVCEAAREWVGKMDKTLKTTTTGI
ncbi:hypothetical protein N7462_005261 [Penicillium macrosclerotiorum]|uniref:uncharacterized protein n=1 Tax=Penicillium macrosclerotiorum TaxID=303699 RepID=UPI002548079E|nr:uncharacterized protein N7462_005261 [Penicillium macrosclerotiorum]KAJ5690869.1 hypothetical protein N7462_005261 [Penicillium macrosclerotiorum]